MKAEYKAWIESILEKFKFVQWDRFFISGEMVVIYGWIDREKDSYKDFILLELFLETKASFYATSSSKYDSQICKILYNKEDHNGCRRVEDNFHIENSIKLKKEVSPTDLAKG